MATQETTTTLTFEPFSRDDERGFEIVDPIDRHRYALRTDSPVAPSQANRDQFLFPVDAAVTVRTATLTLPSITLIHVRDTSGEVLASAEQFAYREFPVGVYILELHTPIKLYLRVESSLRVSADFERTVIEFDDVTSVAVGARSYHDHPAATVTTTADPEDMMAAVSTFGSALKTTGPERAYPTLRGHPPTIELGDELSIPKGLDLPKTDITIKLPAELKYIYPAAPLAYYLGAELVPGDEPRLHGTGFEHALNSERGFENEVERVLKQTFFFDCLTRTEGLYGGDLYERQAIETEPSFDIDLDFAALYHASPTERLATYFSVPFEVIEPLLPKWKLTTHIQPIPTTVEMLPYATDDLAVVRTLGTDDLAPVSPMEACEFDEIVSPTADGELTRGETRDTVAQDTGSQKASENDDLYVQPPAVDSHEQVWIGEGAPVNASKATVEAYNNRLNRTPNDSDVAVTVVCNDAEMGEEQKAVDEIYGTASSLPFDVTIHSDLTRAELRELLANPTEYLHYVGHIDDDGFVCSDGKLDATTLTEVNVDAFLLNTCDSYTQGEALIEAGAIGGIVTINDLFNSAAIQMGCTLARLLIAGFSLRSGLEIARNDSIAGKQYLVIGDGGLTIGQTESGCPSLCEIEHTTEDDFSITYRTYPTEERGMGSTVSPHLPSVTEYHLASSRTQTFEVTQDELALFLSFENFPVKIDGKLRWSNQIDLDKISPCQLP